MIRYFVAGVFAIQMVFAATIEEKRAALIDQGEKIEELPHLSELNSELDALRSELASVYSRAQTDFAAGVDMKDWLDEINRLRSEMSSLQEHWRRLSLDEAAKGEEGYGLWDQEESTIAQLVMEYGSADYLYIIPPDLMKQKISTHSSLPVPRRLWTDLLEVVLSQNGIGVKQLSPLVRQLYAYRQDLMAVKRIITSKALLDRFPPHERVMYVFSPLSEDIKSVFYFFERFRDPKRTYIHQVGNKVAIVSTCEEVQKLLQLYDAVWAEGQKRTIKVMPLAKIAPKEMEKILKTFFGPAADKGRMTVAKGGAHLTMLPLGTESSIALIGIKDTVERAVTLVKDLEEQMHDPLEMTVFSYPCRHSDPVELADMLEKVYSSLAYSNIESGASQKVPCTPSDIQVNVAPNQIGVPTAPAVITSEPVEPGEWSVAPEKSASKHFIPSSKTGTIMMIVRRDLLPKIKDLIKTLDIPKKMVEIEVLIFERKVSSKNNFGMNILRLGSAAQNKHQTGLTFNALSQTEVPGLPGAGSSVPSGILDFFISRAKSSAFPAFDLAYSFLMSQEDVRVNAAPTITTINQTPAKLAIVEEISINNGVAPVETNGVTVFEKSFSRNQFGITLVITPTIHSPDLDDDENKYFVTLDTKVAFDNPQESSRSDQPNVDRSSVENQVRVLNGETVILGGLRRKTAEDATEKIPLLGEIPGIAKLFGTTQMTDKLRELFIFITPRVIIDPSEDAKRLREEALKRRAGDIPEFLKSLEEAQAKQKSKALKTSFDVVFGKN